MPYSTPSTKTAYTTLTATEWNVLVNDIIDLNTRIAIGLSSAPPLSPTLGQLFYATDLGLLYSYRSTVSGPAWTAIGNIFLCLSSNRPTSPQNGMIMYETDTNKTFRYNATVSTWIEISNGYPTVSTANLASITSATTPTVGSVAFDSTTLQKKMYLATGGGSLYLPFGNYLSGTYAQRPTTPFVGQLFYQTDTDELLKYVTDLDGQNRWMQADHDYTRNLLVNGGFDVWQRATSSTVSTADFYGPADRWQTTRVSSDTGRTFSRQPVTSSDTAVSQFTYFMRCQRDAANAATNAINMATSFETTSVKRTQNKYVTLSFYARSGANYSAASGFLRAYITTGTGTDGRLITGSFTSPTTLLDSNNVLTSSWKRFSITTSAAVGNTITQMGVTFQFTPVGTAGAADYYDITGVQIETGTAPSDYEQRELGDELRRCQRYFSSLSSTSSQSWIGTGIASSTSSPWVTVKWPTTMRTAPVVTTPTIGALIFFYGAASSTNPTALSATQYNNVDMGGLTFTTPAVFTSGQAVILSLTASTGILNISAEL
jgi:hypothetical protein